MPRIFLVEPQASLREWCRMHLGAAGFSVAAFDDGHRVLEALRAQTPDLVVVATGLEGMGMRALATEIRSHAASARVPFLFVVARGDASALAQARAIDAEGILEKPFDRETLLKAVRDRLGKPKAPVTDTVAARRPEGEPAVGPARSAISGPLLETKQATVLAIVVRNFVSLARSLSARELDLFLGEFASRARIAVFDAGGWIVRADPMSMVALFEDVPDHANPHGARAVDAALGAVLASRAAKHWGELTLPTHRSIDISVGCGIHAGEVIVARLTVGGHLAPSIAGATADLAGRLEGRAKGLRWSIACTDSALQDAGTRFELGYRSSLTDSDRGTNIPITEIRGYLSGSAKPGELARMGEVREAMLANSLLAGLAGDVDQETADRTLMVRPTRPEADRLPTLLGRRVERRIREANTTEAFEVFHVLEERRELVKIIRRGAQPEDFVEAYLEDFRKLAGVRQRNFAAVYEVGRTGDFAFVALEFVAGASLAVAMHRQLAVGAALTCLAQASMAIDALAGAGIVHGNLAPEHFHFRTNGTLVLTDFNTSQRVGAALGLPGWVAAPAAAPQPGHAGSRADFLALGRILHAMLTGDRMLLAAGSVAIDAADLERTSRLPLPLSPIQPCLDGLLGVNGQRPINQAQDVLLALMSVREAFAFDLRASAGLA